MEMTITNLTMLIKAKMFHHLAYHSRAYTSLCPYLSLSLSLSLIYTKYPPKILDNNYHDKKLYEQRESNVIIRTCARERASGGVSQREKSDCLFRLTHYECVAVSSNLISYDCTLRALTHNLDKLKVYKCFYCMIFYHFSFF